MTFARRSVEWEAMSRSDSTSAVRAVQEEIQIEADEARLAGSLVVPANAHGLVLFAHGSGSSRHSARNRQVAAVLQGAGMATLLFDLLTEAEEASETATHGLRFNIEFLAARLGAATLWAVRHDATAALRIGYFGASTGAAAALVAAAGATVDIGAIVSRGGRPDLAGTALERVRAPTLLIVGAADTPVIPLNERAFARLRGVKRLEFVPDATHLFEEPGALDLVSELAARWFGEYLRPPEPAG